MQQGSPSRPLPAPPRPPPRVAENLDLLSLCAPSLSGRQAEKDIKIEFIGSRPGETLSEKLWTDDESVSPSEHPKIMRLSRPAVDPEWLARELMELERLADDGDTLEVVAKLGSIVREPKRETVPAPETEAATSREEAGRPSGYGEAPWTPSESSPG